MYASAEDAVAAPSVGPDGEPLDDGEAFDLQQMERVIAEDPESLAFHNARKALAATKVQLLVHFDVIALMSHGSSGRRRV